MDPENGSLFGKVQLVLKYHEGPSVLDGHTTQ
jgi:hypothetical protein